MQKACGSGYVDIMQKRHDAEAVTRDAKTKSNKEDCVGGMEQRSNYEAKMGVQY